MSALATARPELDALVASVRECGDGARLGLVVEDVEAAERLAWGADEVFTAASVIKVPVLLAALRRADAGALDLDALVPVPVDGRAGGSGVLKELPSVERLSLRDLLTLMIIVSDNTATNVVIDLLGFEPVAELLRDQGLAATRLARSMMDTAARERGEENLTTAGDMADLFCALVRGEVLVTGSRRTALDVLCRQQVRDRLPRHLPPQMPVAHKTGELAGVRHDAGVLFLGPVYERPVVVTVLTEGFADPGTAGGVSGAAATDVAAEVGRIVHDAYTAAR
ncbi:MAG: serine hydrolase [Streptosporangiales bacterium]